MAAASTEPENVTRHVDESTLYSLNLKIENNFDEYVILSVNLHDNSYLFKLLSTMINTDRLIMFDNIDSSLSYIDSLPNTNIYVIISGTLAQAHVQKFVSKPQVMSLYVYCAIERKHELWTTDIKKIRCTVSNLEQLIKQLHTDIKQWSDRWPFEERSFKRSSTSTSEWYHIFLLVISRQANCTAKSYCEMFDECRTYFKSSGDVLKKIDQLAQTYKPSNAIREYTRDSFLYRITNHALRTQNIEIIKKFSPFITDLHSQLHEYHRSYYHSNEQYIRAVYRGQHLSYDELEHLRAVCRSRNPIIKLTTFTSASLDPEIALNFALPLSGRIPCLFEIIITDEYNIAHKHLSCFTQTFANISSLSAIPGEQEVLFSLLAHFRVKYVGDPVVPSHCLCVPIVLELVTDKGKANSTHLDMAERIEKETNPQFYHDILHLLQVNATDQIKFNQMNWQKWWNKFTSLWGTDLACEQSLLLTLYESFTEDAYYLRKAVGLHKDILQSTLHATLISSSFSDLVKRLKGMQTVPTKGIALYEAYLEQYCTTNTKAVVDCLYFVGELYTATFDTERALDCYRKILDVDVHDEHTMNNKVQKRIKQLPKTTRKANDKPPVVIDDVEKEFQRRYEAQDEQWSVFWAFDCHTAKRTHQRTKLERLRTYLVARQHWYHASDLKIVLRLPYETTEDSSIEFYRSYCFLAIQNHMMSKRSPTDLANNHSLSLWRYEKYMHEWMQLKELERFLQPFQEKSRIIHFEILPQLDQLIEKIVLLITVCTAYICINQHSGRINAHKIRFIKTTNTNTKQLVFFDLRDKDLRTDLEALKEETLVSLPTFSLASDEAQFLDAYM